MDRRAIYINWDGFGWDCFAEAMTRERSFPGLGRLAREGAVLTALTGLPSLTVPMQTTLVTGAWPAGHGNTARYLDPATGRVWDSGRRNDAETIAEVCGREGRRVVAVNQFTLKGRGTVPGDPDNLYLDAGQSCRERFAAARRTWAGGPPDLLCLYCDELDAAGHKGSEPDVLRALRRLDGELARLLDWLSPSGPPRGVTLVLTSDHGMTPFRGRSSLPELRLRLRDLGLSSEVYGAGERVDLPEGLALVTFGLELQIYLRGRTREDPVGLAERLARELTPEPWFGGVLDRPSLQRRGAHPDFADLLLWPRPPHHFKPSSRVYGPRGQHDSPDPSSGRVVFALWGEGVAPGGRQAPVEVVDLAPTLAAILSLPPPRGAVGRIVREAVSL